MCVKIYIFKENIIQPMNINHNEMKNQITYFHVTVCEYITLNVNTI